jgi:exodeoxyribonuclease VII large subunit
MVFMTAELPLTNTPEFSVSDISNALKKTVEGAFSHVRVRGELSRVTIAKSGHLYSDLKDDKAVLNIVCWKGTVQKLPIHPEEGMEVICTGRLTTFPGSSRYQMVIESMELAGEGALLKLLEERKRRLGEEGLFDADRKKPLPFLPKTIGVVTSPTGAVIRDIIHRIRDRFPCHIIVWPVQVQGKGAESQITRGIQGFNKVQSDNRPDIIIIARGGGSLEDLMAFNEESVVRAVAASDIPVISAVGHETDTTLIDYVSDQRAPTPTGAAEMAVPVIDNLRAQIMDDDMRLNQSMKRMIETGAQNLSQTTRILAHPNRMIEPLEQKFDYIQGQLSSNFERYLDHKDKSLHGLSGRLQTPRAVIDKASLSLHNITSRMAGAKDRILPPQDDKLESLSRMLETLSYKNTLDRGFAVLRNSEGNILDTTKAISNSTDINITVKDGSLSVKNRV